MRVKAARTDQAASVWTRDAKIIPLIVSPLTIRQTGNQRMLLRGLGQLGQLGSRLPHCRRERSAVKFPSKIYLVNIVTVIILNRKHPVSLLRVHS